MSTNQYAATQTGLLETVVDELSGDVYFVDPSATLLSAFAEFDAEDISDLSVRVLATEDPLKTIRSDFTTASRLAGLVEAAGVELKTHAGPAQTTVITDGELLYSLVGNSERFAALAADNTSFVTDAYEGFTDLFETSDTFPLRTPGLARTFETLAEAVGTDTRDAFETMLASVETTEGDGLDEVELALLAGAANGELLYDISKWGEDIGLASKATFSRTKGGLEDADIIETEKVPIDVGRPRLRLLLSSELQDAAGEDLIGLVEGYR